jgi:hypothetical protein
MRSFGKKDLNTWPAEIEFEFQGRNKVRNVERRGSFGAFQQRQMADETGIAK